MNEEKSIIDLARESQERPTAQPASSPAPEMNSGNMSNVPEDPRMKKALDGLLENVREKLQYVDVKLPSNGVLYEGASHVSIRPLTFNDERGLRNIKDDSNADIVISNILGACMKGVPVEELTPPDRIYLLFKLREFSYGDDYKLEQNCGECRVKNALTLKISTLDVNYLESDYTTFILPDSQKEVSIKVPKATQIAHFDTLETIMKNLHVFVNRVSEVNDPIIIQEFIRQTTVKDVDVLRNKIFVPTYGMEDKLIFNCKKCGAMNKASVALNEYFFTAS